MKRIIGLVALFFLFLGCTEKKEPVAPQSAVSPNISSKDSDSTSADTCAAPIPVTVDELFDDFVYGFTSNAAFQKKRIQFPLKHIVNERVAEPIEKKKWKFDAIHMKRDYYTVLYNNEKQLSLEKSSKISQIAIELIFSKKQSFRQYVFERLRGQWFLTCIKDMPLYKNKNAQFFSFYNRFVSDSVYQRTHVSNPLGFVTYDEENHYEKIDGIVDLDQWFVFRPDLPKGILTNIDYGQTFKDSKERVFVMNGNSNGMRSIFKFRKINNSWVLVRFEN